MALILRAPATKYAITMYIFMVFMHVLVEPAAADTGPNPKESWNGSRTLDQSFHGFAAASGASSESTFFYELMLYLQQRKHISDPGSLLPMIINPFSPLLLCDLHYGQELDPPPEVVTRSLTLDNVNATKPLDIICVNSNDFDTFATSILPLISVHFILITSRWHLPQVKKCKLTDEVKGHPKIAHWFAQNPIYQNDDRYTGFPYGILHLQLEAYAESLLANQHTKKQVHVEHLTINNKTHSSRKRLSKYIEMSVHEYYAHIARAKYLLSPRGDRPDTYRHWEAIGLGTIPISNIDRHLYEPIFENDMIYAPDVDYMLNVYQNATSIASEYHVPNKNRICSAYWARQVFDKQQELRSAYPLNDTFTYKNRFFFKRQ